MSQLLLWQKQSSDGAHEDAEISDMIKGTHKSARVFEYWTGMRNVRVLCEGGLRRP